MSCYIFHIKTPTRSDNHNSPRISYYGRKDCQLKTVAGRATLPLDNSLAWKSLLLVNFPVQTLSCRLIRVVVQCVLPVCLPVQVDIYIFGQNTKKCLTAGHVLQPAGSYFFVLLASCHAYIRIIVWGCCAVVSVTAGGQDAEQSSNCRFDSTVDIFRACLWPLHIYG